MPEVYRVKHIKDRLRAHRKLLQSVVHGLRVAKIEQEQIFARGGLASEVKTAIELRLSNLEDIKDEAKSDITDLRAGNKTIVWAKVFRPGNYANIHHFNIDVDNGSGQAEIFWETIDSEAITLPGPPFSDSDGVQIINAEDSDMNGIYTIASCSITLLTLDQDIGGADNSSDEKMEIIRWTRA